MLAFEQMLAPGSVDKLLHAWMRLQDLIVEPTNLLVLFLFAVGIVLKQSKHIPDWIIIFVMPILGAVVGYGMFDVVLHKLPALTASMLGFVYGVGATFFHQCLKNLLESPFGSTMMKIPLMPIVAGLMGVDFKVEQSVINNNPKTLTTSYEAVPPAPKP